MNKIENKKSKEVEKEALRNMLSCKELESSKNDIDVKKCIKCYYYAIGINQVLSTLKYMDENTKALQKLL